MPDQFQFLSDTLYRERVLHARRTPPEERLIEGIRMFDRECEAMRVEICKTNPNFSKTEIAQEIRRRLKEADAENEATHYRPVPKH